MPTKYRLYYHTQIGDINLTSNEFSQNAQQSIVEKVKSRRKEFLNLPIGHQPYV